MILGFMTDKNSFRLLFHLLEFGQARLLSRSEGDIHEMIADYLL